MQRFVEEAPEQLLPSGCSRLHWVSPVACDSFREYQDGMFLKKLGFERLAPELETFWPKGGPVWDGLALTDGLPVLVEAKAHVSEFFSPPSRASEESLTRIKAAFAETQSALSLIAPTDWTKVFYQYANRLAHLGFLHREGVKAHLLLVGFLHDAEMKGPVSAETWQALHRAADHALGLPLKHRLSPFVHLVTPSVRDLSSGVSP
ncbi:hypothetical protein VK792_03070 [Mesobacterium sp. TK19101]|uniref:Uncharacterized protein n=1 Tax=Mesobacterium hydrothermale TaxID=3111907 RepID=A0ABU6HCQ1_9RHOB|nr:hypothetical protein [Mesobacterium sp. TK19101]MEC3860253.1 hypothetical protein [Mesobacterium sp. TK19101]